MFETEISKLDRIANTMPSAPLGKMLKEICPVATKVDVWHSVPTSGFVVCRYDQGTGAPDSYEVTAQTGNLGCPTSCVFFARGG